MKYTLILPSHDLQTILELLDEQGLDLAMEIREQLGLPDERESDDFRGEDLDGDHASALASAGFGTNKDYEHGSIGAFED
jgi:hypothetical protein